MLIAGSKPESFIAFKSTYFRVHKENAPGVSSAGKKALQTQLKPEMYHYGDNTKQSITEKGYTDKNTGYGMSFIEKHILLLKQRVC